MSSPSTAARIAAVPVIATFGLGATLLVAPPAAAAGFIDGPAAITLPKCGGSAFGEFPVPLCTYVALPKKDGGAYYAFLTSSGEVRMDGSLQSGRLTFPVKDQDWPGFGVPGGAVTVTVKKSDITGQVDAAGNVVLTMPYEATISAGLFGTCSAKGSATMTSEGSDVIGGGTGRAREAATGSFAAAGTAPAPGLSGKLCDAAKDYIDFDRGLGLYLDGSLALTPAAAGTQQQTAAVDVPARIKRKGRTVLLDGQVITSANQAATAKVTWGSSKAANGANRRQAKVVTNKGAISIRPTGKAKRLFVKLALQAPAVSGYGPFSWTRVWKVR